jgi:hypothetical protein
MCFNTIWRVFGLPARQPVFERGTGGMNFSEQPPSKQWAALKYRGEKFAEVWFKPEGEPFGLTFRIPQKSFQVPGMSQHLTPENLLKAVAIAPEDVESWRQGDVSHAGMDGAHPEFRNPLPPPPPDFPHLGIYIRLKPLPQTDEGGGRRDEGRESAPQAPVSSLIPQPSSLPEPTPQPAVEGGAAEIPVSKWQDLEARWKAILGLEATVETLRISMEGLRAEMEASLKKSLTPEEKLHALRADVAEWNKAKSRVHHALPRLREYIHRSTWAIGDPERKQLEELYKNHIKPHLPFPQMDKALTQLENMQKDRQVLSGLGTAVYHECKGIAASVQGALRTLQSNAAAHKKKNAKGAKGKFFKDIRKISGAE